MTAKEFLMDYILNHPDNYDVEGKPFTDNLTEFFYEIGGGFLYKESLGNSRWWENLFLVQEINGKLIGYNWATTTGDTNAQDRGWEFDEDSVCFVEPYTEKVVLTKYKKILD